ncbi:gliding motility lipoprotein GldB [Tenacibaculum sp. SZ-18]|uniref:gliding motility lipoprotein GldB n=1 Tax=Tenacibaculum sp. SZ-18 TaxID=754423 RepID=UPI000C2D416A|nr:gliding motility lipoprotein GldB [Tenacibaculum sp. SZ-18]AUC16221.1 gliding motility lipoprotein GldB [Tenacibaculum sp. SZ-18]
MRKIFYFSLMTLFAMSCKNENKLEVDVSNINIDLKLARFDVDFYNSSPETLSKIKEIYPMFFPHDIDSVWLNKIQNKDEQELFAETQKIYPNLTSLEKQLEQLFQYVKYYDENFQEPVVISMLTNVDYENRVLFDSELLLISLDCYLGATHKFYIDFPEYIRQNNREEHIIVDVANAIINKQMNPNSERSFINKMIYEGKKMAVLDSYLPNVSDREKIGYTQKKFDWAMSSEEDIWKYFIERELLYDTNAKLNKRFLDIAPFSKFYLGEDHLSPGRIGVWIGWQIVRSYMENNDVSLSELLRTEEDIIFKKSKYKPKR